VDISRDILMGGDLGIPWERKYAAASGFGRMRVLRAV
jgi:hypothetical protein